MEAFGVEETYRRKVAVKDIAIDNNIVQVQISEVGLQSYFYSFALLAEEENKEEMLGYIGFALEQNNFFREHGFLELQRIQVDQKYQFLGLGAFLLRSAQTVIAPTIVLHPRRPGESLPNYERNKLHPLTTEELREFYKCHGFREFTDEEVELIGLKKDDSHFGRELVKAELCTEPESIPLEDKITMLSEKFSIDSLRKVQQSHRETMKLYLRDART
ncbi:MAG TPA: hypothetical protein VJB66_05275 [Candidatus Nanoarchaeia archaeon]|nr:hypothetical protein [Candidatus Nanoarchaeia archaeon]